MNKEGKNRKKSNVFAYIRTFFRSSPKIKSNKITQKNISGKGVATRYCVLFYAIHPFVLVMSRIDKKRTIDSYYFC
jgi:hypothetical protein